MSVIHLENDRASVARRLLFILHRGLVEVRKLAAAGESRQLFDLADALETLPGFLDDWREEHLESIRFNLRTYQDRYPGAFDYLAHLDREEPPERF